MLISVIGIPLIGLAILFIALYTYLSKIVVGQVLGNWLSQRLNLKLSAYWPFAIGLLGVYILKAIPVLGFFSGPAVLWLGLGAYAIRFASKE